MAAPTESRIFASRYERETKRLEKLHSSQIAPGTVKWMDAIDATFTRMEKAGSPIKQTKILTGINDYLRGVKPEEQTGYPLVFYHTKRAAGMLISTIEFDSHPLVGPKEDGVCVLRFSIGVQRNGHSHINSAPLAYISRHAMERMHERRTREITNEMATDLINCIAAVGHMVGFHPKHDAMCVNLGDVLAVGKMRGVAGEPNKDGKRVYAMMYEVRTLLPIAELDENDIRLRQGNAAINAVCQWAKEGRMEAEKHAKTIPILRSRADDYSSKTAVKSDA